ncbi:MAG TPA: DUF58 domain-containing protein [Candidatus Methylomirabilis sp.]|nr:DUF58 domain-containing protein [Candidatus Methylomirabilis sp.]
MVLRQSPPHRTPPRPYNSAPEPTRKRYWLPRTIRPTREGWWFIGATIAIGLAATNTGNNLLYLILAMMLSFMVVSGILSEQTMRHLSLQRELPRRVFAGVPAVFGLRLVNRKRRLPSYALHLSEADPAGGRSAHHFLLRLAPQGREAWQYRLGFPRRGRHGFPGVQVLTRFPFGLFAKISRPILCDPLLVYPGVRALAPDELPAALGPGWHERERRGQGAGLYNLRQYRPGDDPRMLHWKTSAKAGELMLKESEEEDRPHVRLVVADPAPQTPPLVVEANLSYAASLAAHAIRLACQVQLVTAEGSTEFGQGEAHLDRILERLALYEVPASPRPLPISAGSGRTVQIRLDARRPTADAGA